MPLLLGIDLGTTYFKVGLFRERGELCGLGRVAVATQCPAPGRCELAVADFWRLLRRGLDDALAQARAVPSDIAGVSYSAQANSFVLLDAVGIPLTPLVIWTDKRGEPVEARLQTFATGEDFARTAGFAGISGEFAIAKWRWFQMEHPLLWSRARHVLTMSDYFTFALTGEFAGDASTAAFLGLLDLRRMRWWSEALAACEIDATRLSQPFSPGSPVGRTTPPAAGLLGVPTGIPFAVGALDHHAAAIGSGIGRVADVSVSTGTVLAALRLVREVEPIASCYHGRHIDGTHYFRLAFDPDGAGKLEAYQRTHAPGIDLQQLLALTVDAPASAHGTAMGGLVARICESHRVLVARISAGEPVRRVVATGGGARSPILLQMCANALGVPVVTPASPERACLGAAMFAAVAAGVHRHAVDAALAMVQPAREYPPKRMTGAIPKFRAN